MVKTIRFKRGHLKEMNEFVFGIGQKVSEKITTKQAISLENRKHSYTFVHNGRVLACAGVTEYPSGTVEAWAILDKEVRHNFIGLFRQFKKALIDSGIERIEAIIDDRFLPCVRLARALKFKLEGEKYILINGGQDA